MTYTQEEINLIILSSFTELTYHQKSTLLSNLSSASPDFVKYREFLIKSVGDGVYNKVRADFYSDAYRSKVLKELAGKGIKCITCFSQDYPAPLKNTPLPPIVLYCKGNVELLKNKCFGVVGSRRTLKDVLAHCKKVSQELTQHFTVVTGMADGADSAAIEGALPSGKIISVLAYGFDHVYPQTNAHLVKSVEKQGLLITEHPPEVSPQPYNFPIRNRIIAGLSDGVLIVSAGKKSGALITAEYSEEYGRETFAFPYGIGVPSGEGCNTIIKNYAHLAENTLDIFAYYGLDFKPQENKPLTADEEKLLIAVREGGEAFISELAEKLGTMPFRLIPTLSSLEIKGYIVRLGGNRFKAI